MVSYQGARIQSRRYGKGFLKAQRQVRDQELFNCEELHDLRVLLLRSHLVAASSTPFWSQRFKDYGIVAEAKDPFYELSKLPILTKDVVKAQANNIINPLYRRNLLWRHTSGSTGSGLVFPETPSTEHYTWAFWWRYRNWHGLTRQSWCGYFGGRSLVPLNIHRPPYWRINRPARQLMFSGYHLSPDTALEYLKALRIYSIEWLHGYPSILALLAGYIIDKDISVSLPHLKCITTGAENLSKAQRDVIGKAFHVPVFQHYGQAEASANISECEYSQLHVDEDFAAIEMLESTHDLYSARLIGTNWLNPAFPLLRYDTGDLVIPGTGECPCGRPGRLVASIDGRKEDYLSITGGTRIGRLDHIFKDMTNIREAQFVQHEADSVTLLVVRGACYSNYDQTRLLQEVRQRIGSVIRLEIKYVDTLPRGPNGKLRLVVSTLPLS